MAPWLLVAGVGALLIAAGIVCQVMMLYVSIKTRKDRVDESGDPWDGRTLEWITTSPPPAFNFAVLPDVKGEEAYWGIKAKARENRALSDLPDYEPIEMPRNSPTGIVAAFFATAMGFALIWHIWWLVILGFFGAWGRSSSSPGATRPSMKSRSRRSNGWTRHVGAARRPCSTCPKRPSHERRGADA